MPTYDWPDLIKVGNWPSSAEYRQRDLAGQTVLLSFSRGKDAIAAWLAARAAGATVIPYYLTMCYTREDDGTLTPGMRFEQQSLAYFEQVFDTPILKLPHPSFWRALRTCLDQSPDRLFVLDCAQLVRVGYDTINDIVRRHHGLPADTWTLDGVRAADSPNRRTSMIRFGPMNTKRRTYRAIYDWRKAHVLEAIDEAGIELPIDYRIWGRTFDGLDHRFVGPLAEHLPDDFARLRRWFPLIPATLYRQQLIRAYRPELLPSKERKRAAVA